MDSRGYLGVCEQYNAIDANLTGERPFLLSRSVLG